MKKSVLVFLLLLVVSFLSPANCLFAVDTGELRSYSNIHSIGIEWELSGDTDHNSACRVKYRKKTTAQWKQALNLFRIDFNSADMLAGSILHLDPGTTYTLQLDLSDPDSTSVRKTLDIMTRAVPVQPVNGRVMHVVPGNGGGSGSAADPFRGIDSAQSSATPGDTFLLHAGSYPGEIIFDKSGQAGDYVVWKGAGGGEVIIETVRIATDFVWLEGVHVTGNTYGIRTYNSPEGVVVTKNKFTECNYCVYLNHGGSNWYITDNIIVGDVAPESGSFGGEGIELNHSNGHVAAYNSITHVADGISYPGRNCDIYGNDIFDVSDDGIEPDYGYANNRIWANRISNAYHNGISFQPMNGAPWYILRNQVAAPLESGIKFRGDTDRALIAHNTFVSWQGAQKYGSSGLLAVQSNNNLWISMTDWYAWENGDGGSADWRTNLDYDGFDWGDYVYGFKWGERYQDLAAFSAATGLEQHGIRIDKDTCFATLNIPSPPPASMPMQYMTLKPSCNAVDAGIVLPNINDDFQGNGPDLGAYELGGSLPHYGPRRPKAFPWLLLLSSIKAQEELLKSTGTGDNEK
ncbi:MAG: hypothetical protein GQ559_06505 [Desulfobulbaceae bacterium]|nr:hypothetical protein [Desulfobulbaceae bacterium]